MTKTLVVIAGPTGIGKTDFAIKMALHFKTEILSADSRQIYKELNIGVAKPTDYQLKQVKHHFVNHVSIYEEYNAGRFEEEGLRLLEQLFLIYDVVILCGGSGLYIDALCKGFDQLPAADMRLRNELRHLFETHGISALQQLLKEKDPVYFSEADIHNPQRLIRALEVCLSTGKPYSSFRKKRTRSRPFNIISIGLNIERKLLYDAINTRVDYMVASGWEEEAQKLYPYRKLNALQTVGYEEWFRYFEGHLSREETIEKIKQHTRHYARRQLTWFRKNKNIHWFAPHEIDKAITWVEQQVEK